MGSKADDPLYIEAALHGEFRTETKQGHRGKGLPEIYSAIVTSASRLNNLTIVSGHAECNVAKNGIEKRNYINATFEGTPGGRFKSEGDFSGEDFRDSILIPKYLEAVKQNQLLCINLDGGYGYGSSFLEEAFGGLVRKINKVDISVINIISDEEPQLKLDIMKYLKDALKVREEK